MQLLDSSSLIRAQRAISVPFMLRAKRIDDNRTIEVKFLKILRLLPGKRIVALTECDGQQVLVKAFLGRTAKRYAARERSGVEMILNSGVRSPKLLWQAGLVGGHGQLLALEYLPDSVSLQDRWNAATEDDERIDVLTRAMIIIAKLHNQGVVQTDIHLANFLMSQSRMYTIDGGGIVRKSAPPLVESMSIENLSWFFAQFFPRFDEFVQLVLPAYDAVRGWPADPERVINLHSQINQSRELRKKAYLAKSFRDCTRFLCRSSFTKFLVCEREEFQDEEFAAVLADPDSYIANGTILKDGNTATVAQVDLSHRSLVVKRYNIKGPLHALSRAVRKSRAWLSWLNAFHMEFLGIPSLKPLAMIENRIGPFRGKAYFITEYIDGPDALARLRDSEASDGELRALANLLVDLSNSRISHGDLKATNFLMAAEGPVIIDLDAMRQHKNPERFQKAFDKDLDRFMKNWEDQPELVSRFEGLLKFPG